MMRKVWKWIYGVSLTMLIILGVFTIGIWALGNATAAMAGTIMGHIDPDNFGYRYLYFREFVINSIGSPIFYVETAALAVHFSSIVALAITRKPKAA